MEMKNKSIKHWVVLMVCCGLSAASIGLIMNSVGVFYTPVSESLGIMRGTFAIHATISMLLASAMSFFVPVIMRKYSYKLVLIISVLIASSSTVLMGLSTNILSFYVLAAVRGISSAFFAIVPLTMIINQWFEKKHGLATSITLGFSGAIGALFSPILASFIESYGWEMTYLIKGVFLLLMGLPAILYPFSLNPQDDGLLPYGFEGIKEKGEDTLKKQVEFNFRQLGFVCFLGFATLMAVITAIAQHLPGFAESVGYSASTGAMLVSAVMMGNIISKLIIGVLSDRVGVLKAAMMMSIVNILGIILLLIAANTWMFLIGGFLFGAIFSVASVGTALLTKKFYTTKSYPTIYPVVSFVGGLGVAFATSLIGYIYDFTGSFTSTFIIALASHGISVVLLSITIINLKSS